MMERMAVATSGWNRVLRQHAGVPADGSEQKRELADLSERYRDAESDARAVAGHYNNQQRHHRLANHHDCQRADQQAGRYKYTCRIQQHADGEKEHHGESVSHGKPFGAGDVATCPAHLPREALIHQRSVRHFLRSGPAASGQRNTQRSELARGNRAQ